MDAAEIQDMLKDKARLRVGAQTAEYVRARLAAGGKFAVMGRDARTGAARRQVVDARTLAAPGPDRG